MKLDLIPRHLEQEYDSDSLVYVSDSHFHYNTQVDKNLIDDILNHEIQIYSGYYTYRKKEDTPRLYYLGRGKRSGKVKIKIQGYYPYGYEYDEDGDSEDYLGRKCNQLIFKGQHPSKVAKYRDNRLRRGFPQPLESDILFHRRLLISTYDYFKPTEPIEPKIAVLDIETDYPVSDKIIAFAVNGYDNYLYYESKFESTEEELVESLFEQVEKYDIVTGWNIEFDMKEIDRKSKVKLHEVVSVVDLHKDNSKSIAKKMLGREIRGRWSLDNTGSRLCGIAKSLDEDDMKGDVRDLNEEKLFQYNVIDTIIPEIIDNYLGGIETHLILAWSLHSCVDDMIITAVVNDVALLRAYHREGKVLPSRNYDKEPKPKPGEYKYKAAEPDARPGVYDDIIGEDIVHAYPSAVISKNISPESKDIDGRNITPPTPNNPNGVAFNDDDSIFITTLTELMVDRAKIKKKLKLIGEEHPEYKKYKFIDFALKTEIAALSHGMFGWASSRVKDYDIADAITAVVREIINKIKGTCDLIGHRWVYSHTDSVFLIGKKEDAMRITKYLNEMIKNFCKGYKIIPELEFEGYYPIGYIHSKARRVLIPEGIDIDDDENWVVKGMSFLRSETPTPLGDIEIKIIKSLLKKIDKNKILNDIRDDVKKLANLSPKELAIIKPLNKPIDKYGRILQDGSVGGIPYHITALKRSQKEFNLEINIGSKFCIIPIITDEITGVRKIKRKRVDIAFDMDDGLPDEYIIDFEYYLRSNLWGKISQMLEMKAKDLEKEILTDDVKDVLNIKYDDEE